MAIKTATEQLEEIQTSISDILAGAQSYSISGRALTKADLGTLYEAQARLYPLAKREESGRTGARVRYVEVGQ